VLIIDEIVEKSLHISSIFVIVLCSVGLGAKFLYIRVGEHILGDYIANGFGNGITSMFSNQHVNAMNINQITRLKGRGWDVEDTP
jgi:hypothetical protein